MADTPTIINNTKDWYDLADTIVKIGLGTFIAGGFTYLTNKSNHKHEFSKEKFNIKKDMLIDATNKVELYFRSVFVLLDHWYGRRSLNISKIDDLNESQLKSEIELDNSYMNNVREVRYALSKFNILGAKELSNLIRNYDAQIIDLRNDIVLKKVNYPTQDETIKIMHNLKQIEESYQEKVKEYFDNLK